MRRLPAFVFVAFGALVPMSAGAQEAAAVEPAEAVAAVVRGLSADDLLNIREAPSALGRTLGRLPNGSLVRRQQCELVERYEWCRVEAVDGEELSGWAPGRYLEVLDVAAPESAASEIAAPEIAAPEIVVPDIAGGEPERRDDEPAQASIPAPTPAPRGAEAEPEEEDDGKAARLSTDSGVPALPPGLEERFATGSSVPINEVRRPAAGTAPDLAEQEEDLPSGTAAEEPPGDPQEGRFDPSMPTPSPRPTSDQPVALGPEAAEGGPETAAPADPAAEDRPDGGATHAEATGSIPCARYIGQPMTRCGLRVAPRGEGAADLTILWPDGGTRLVEFRDGVPAGSNSSETLRHTREGSLNMIRIGPAERFEILDALALGR